MMPVMLALPVHAATDEETHLLKWLLRKQTLLRKIQPLASRLQADVVVYTSLPFVEEHCRDSGFACRTMPFDAANEPQSAFFGLAATAKYIEQTPNANGTGFVFFLNWRNVASVAALAQELASALQKTGTNGLASVVEVEDHPVQFLRMLEFVAFELLVRVDDGGPCFLGRKCTRPFAFDVASIASEDCDSTQELELRQIGPCVQLRPARGTEAQIATLAEQGRLYLRAGPSSLRRVVPRDLSPAGAIPAFGDPAQGKAKLFANHREGWDLHLCSELAHAQPVVQVLGLHPGVSEPQACAACCTGSSQQDSSRVHGHAFAGPFAHISALEQFDALVVMISRDASGPNVEFSRPFEITNDYWRLDGASGDFLNIQTGTAIHGRQDFPRLFELDFSFMVMPVERLGDIARMLQKKNIQDVDLNSMCLSKKQSLRHVQRVQRLHFMAETAAAHKV